ncbi:WbuC family cupin fold metalloprotein [Uliginosibacterium sp. 31-16]|uniref:WbuC family cupin fold metalloprotein n=1 Tax=Uliginosibacterium sp. 31-16 TaxID=3068315 RepID=UPI00273F469A|nr:WbuC family cupin fold metalloprotein [Uliginosibacterium sp. 31-16]MDP5240943.1 WbuC family cupin fold metalloprotein [Uliginosibacterium sp. 31-16]
MLLFDEHLLDQLSAAARANPRLRQNHNLHTSPADAVQRFFNAIEPGSYVMPHCHLAPDKAETLLMLRGRLGLILFDEHGTILDTHTLAPASACTGFHLAPGRWHSVVALTTDTVFFETKAGPYQPLEAAERAVWAPAEGAPAAAGYHATLHKLFSA